MLRQHMHRRHMVLHCKVNTHDDVRISTQQIARRSDMLHPLLSHAQPYSFTQQSDLHLIQATCIAKQCSIKACHYSSIVSRCSAARRLLLALGFTGSWWDSACLFAFTPCAVSSLVGWTCKAASIIGEVVTTHKVHTEHSRHTCHMSHCRPNEQVKCHASGDLCVTNYILQGTHHAPKLIGTHRCQNYLI